MKGSCAVFWPLTSVQSPAIESELTHGKEQSHRSRWSQLRILLASPPLSMQGHGKFSVWKQLGLSLSAASQSEFCCVELARAEVHFRGTLLRDPWVLL
jgi:hypothetical protein